MNHTERLAQIMERNKPVKKEKVKQVEVKTIAERENMSYFQRSFCKLTYAGNIVYLPFERLDNYNDIRKALLDAGAKYKNNTFIFPNDAEPFINRIMGGEDINIKKQFQFFATPKHLAKRIIEGIEFFEGATVLEPSAGQGAFLDELQNSGVNIMCVELMPENCEILKRKGYDPINEDFLEMDFHQKFDFIIANPPFSKNQDIDHFMHMFKYLKNGGRMDVIVSPHFTFANDKKSKEFRAFLDDSGGTWEEIEAGEFKESGTNIKTVLITLRK